MRLCQRYCSELLLAFPLTEANSGAGRRYYYTSQLKEMNYFTVGYLWLAILVYFPADSRIQFCPRTVYVDFCAALHMHGLQSRDNTDIYIYIGI